MGELSLLPALDGLAGFLLAALALAGSPGPATLSLAATGAAFGARRGVGYLAGIVIGMLGVMAAAASGIAVAFLALPGVGPVVAIFVAGYFLYLAWRIATAPPLGAATAPRHPPSFAAGLLLSLVNPKGYAAMAALFSGFVLVRADRLADALAKMALLFALIATVNIAWLAAGAALTGAFRHPAANRVVNVIFALALLASLWFALRL